MEETRFWTIVDRTAVYEADSERQLEALTEALTALSADDVVAFANTTEQQLARAYQWDLWAVGYIIEGGMSDDGFEYFRRWLLSKGRATFEHVLAHPDDLADMIAEDSLGDLEFEAFTAVAWEVWGAKTGNSPDEIPINVDALTLGVEPAGEPFEDDPAWLRAHFPKTWARFG